MKQRKKRAFLSERIEENKVAAEQTRKEEEIRTPARFSPEGDLEILQLGDIIDSQEIQKLMDNFYALARIPMAIIDIKGKVLVGVGWQDICTKFHRVHPETCRNCIESDVELTAEIPEGEFKLYKCKNGMWDIATPILVGGKHMGNLFMGQFVLDDEPLNYAHFISQAKHYGFNETEYITALEKVTRLSRGTLEEAKAFFLRLARMLSQTSYSNIKLARMLEERGKKEDELRRLNRTLKALSDSSQAMMLARDEFEYMKRACQIIIEDCGFKMVWIGFCEEDKNKTIRPVESYGFEEGYLEKLNLTWADTERGRGPTGTAIRTGKSSLCRNMMTDPAFTPWREEALKRGYASSIVLPLMTEGKAFGALNIYSKNPDPFSEAEISLLTELANDLAQGIITIRLRTAEGKSRRQIEDLNAFLKQRADDLALANKELEAFSYSVSHDLRNPLNAIITNIEVLSMDLGERGSADAKEALKYIGRSAERMAQVITDLLTLSGISRRPIQSQEVDLSAMSSAVIGELRVSEPLREVRTDIQPGLRVNADRGLMRHLIENLIRNAWKFSANKTPALIAFGKETRGNESVYFIRDNGAGFNMDQAGKLFKPYQRLHSVQEYTGTGIGLSIAKRIVEKHNGRIWAEGETGKGAAFYFTFGTG